MTAFKVMCPSESRAAEIQQLSRVIVNHMVSGLTVQHRGENQDKML